MSENLPSNPRELTLTRVIPVKARHLFDCWTKPELITKWFTPPPFTVSHAETDLRPGGSTLIVMRSPEGVEIPNRGVYLEVVPDQKLVFTDAYTEAWIPSEKPFMTATIEFLDQGDGTTLYKATVVHWTVEDKEEHERMGFHAGWGIATDQLAALAACLG